MRYDAITFLVDPGIYHASLHDFLTEDEKKQELFLKPLMSRQRFVVSRTALKHILQEILPEVHNNDIILIRDEHGRICVNDYPSLYISLSYSGSDIAVTVGKRKLGCDIEIVRPLRDKKITGSPFFNNFLFVGDKGRTEKVIHAWTLVESYAKLYDKNPYPLLTNTSFFSEVNFISYCIEHKSIFSLASRCAQLTDLLVWLDTSGLKKRDPR